MRRSVVFAGESYQNRVCDYVCIDTTDPAAPKQLNTMSDSYCVMFVKPRSYACICVFRFRALSFCLSNLLLRCRVHRFTFKKKYYFYLRKLLSRKNQCFSVILNGKYIHKKKIVERSKYFVLKFFYSKISIYGILCVWR